MSGCNYALQFDGLADCSPHLAVLLPWQQGMYPRATTMADSPQLLRLSAYTRQFNVFAQKAPSERHNLL